MTTPVLRTASWFELDSRIRGRGGIRGLVSVIGQKTSPKSRHNLLLCRPFGPQVFTSVLPGPILVLIRFVVRFMSSLEGTARYCNEAPHPCDAIIGLALNEGNFGASFTKSATQYVSQQRRVVFVARFICGTVCVLINCIARLWPESNQST